MHTRELIWLVCTGAAWRSQGPHLRGWHNKLCNARCGCTWENKSGLKYNEWKNKYSAVVKELRMNLVCWLMLSKQINAPVYIPVLRCSYSPISLLWFHLPMVLKPTMSSHNKESFRGLMFIINIRYVLVGFIYKSCWAQFILYRCYYPFIKR